MKKELTDQEKLLNANAGINCFVKQFGDDDIVKEAFLDVLLDAIYGNDIYLPSKAEQVSDSPISESRTREMPTYKIE